MIKKFLLTVLRVDQAGAESGISKAREFFKETDALLASDGRRYLLATEEPTFVDYSFAALAAIHVLPSNYGGRQLNSISKPDLSDASPELEQESRRSRIRRPDSLS